MIEFKPAPNTPRPFDAVEVWMDGKMVATIWPHGEAGIVVRSQHIQVHGSAHESPTFLEYLFRFLL